MNQEFTTDLTKLNETRQRLQAVVQAAAKSYSSCLKKIASSDGRKDRAIRNVLKYPAPLDELITKEDEKIAIAAGYAYMQSYSELVAVDTIIMLMEAHDSENNQATKQEENANV